ncbi:MAG: hypothetical protein ACD_87C00286G0002, partial [uncultured bacterium]
MEATKPLLWTWRWPIIESVIWPIIMFLKVPATETKARTKTTPTVIREAVRRVLLLYRSRFRIAILNRLPIAVSSPALCAVQSSIFQRENRFRLADDLLIVGGKDKGGLEFVPHLFHQIQHHVCRAMVQIG